MTVGFFVAMFWKANVQEPYEAWGAAEGVIVSRMVFKLPRSGSRGEGREAVTLKTVSWIRVSTGCIGGKMIGSDRSDRSMSD